MPTTRAVRRLEIAADLMGWLRDVPILDRIKALESADRERLRGVVDWVEDYERHEDKSWRAR